MEQAESLKTACALGYEDPLCDTLRTASQTDMYVAIGAGVLGLILVIFLMARRKKLAPAIRAILTILTVAILLVAGWFTYKYVDFAGVSCQLKDGASECKKLLGG